MALSFYSGTFTMTSGVTTQAVSGVGFQPKVILFYWTRATAEGFVAGQAAGIGVAVDRATDQQSCISWFSTDGASPTSSVTHKSVADCIRNISAVTPAWNIIASISSFDSDGFTINKTTNDGTSLNIIKFMCWGGSDITDAHFAEYTGPTAGGTGNRAFTGVGFQGNFLMTLAMPRPATGGTTSNTDMALSIGAAVSSSNRACVSHWSDSGSSSTGASQCESYFNSAKCLAIYNAGIGGVDHLADFVSFDSDGFTLNYSTAVTSSYRFFGLVLQGSFQAHVGTQARKVTTTGTVDYTSIGFQPVGLIVAGMFATADATETAGAHLCLGATDGTRQHSIAFQDAATISTDVNSYSNASNVYSQISNVTTVAAQAAWSSWLSNGYQLNWGTVDGNARQFMHVAFASAASSLTPTVASAALTGVASRMDHGLFTRTTIRGQN
jgi:hypothetical protein